MKHMTITALRKNIYSIVDKVIKTGTPAVFEKNGNVLRITIDKKPDKLANLKEHDVFIEDPEELIYFSAWNPEEWNGPNNL